jgi:hypothetical protein
MTPLMPGHQIVVTFKVLQKSSGTTPSHLAQLLLCKLGGCENVLDDDIVEVIDVENEKHDIEVLDLTGRVSIFRKKIRNFYRNFFEFLNFSKNSRNTIYINREI